MDKPIEYEQYDARWAAIPYTITGSSSQTIKTSACGPTCAAMVIATLRDKNITPVEAAAWSVAHGYRTQNSGTAWAFFAAYFAEYGIEMEQTGDTEKALAALAKGLMVITAASKGIWTSSGHFILAYGYDAATGKVYVNDPNSEAAYRELADVNYYRAQTAQYFIVKEEWGVDQKQFNQFYSQMMAELKDNDASDWSEEGRQFVVNNGIVLGDGSADPNYQWEAPMTREAMSTMLYRFAKFLGKA